MPVELAGQERIEFRAGFEVESLPERLGLVFEAPHIESLSANGIALDLANAVEVPIWDLSCRMVDATAASTTGANTVEGVLLFQRFETSVVNTGFYHFHPMPCLDVCLAGPFRLTKGGITRDERPLFRLPLDLSDSGWEHYPGIASIQTRVELGVDLAARVRGLAIDLSAEDCLEVLVDGVSIGRRIVRPYVFQVGRLAAGAHTIELRVTGTSGNILDQPSSWSVESVEWRCEEPQSRLRP